MGSKLENIYAAIKTVGGIRAQMRLAMITGLPSQMARTAPDSPELISKFERAYAEITAKEFPIRPPQEAKND